MFILQGFFILKTKFLIIRFSSIGDIVLTSPVVRCLKTQFPEAEIHYLTKKRNADLLQANPYIDQIHLLDDSLSKTIRELKAQRFDFIIDLHNNIRSLRVKLALQTRSVSFNKLNFRKFFLTRLKLNLMPEMHIVDRNMATLSRFNIANDGRGLEHFIPEEDEFSIDELPGNFRNGYVALVLAGTYFTKRMPAAKYKGLITGTDYPFVLLGGKSERLLADEIRSWGTTNVADFTGKLRFNQSASLVKNARLVIANDTGLMHIAAAFHKKILSVWGNTTPELGMYPYLPGAGSEILEVKGLKCRPCSKLGYHECPQKHFRCMMDIPEENIIEWVKREFTASK
ncbi:MAG: glycosyltransferase family 9 protein [Prolixibacteraceae bacterium]|nr:glycosyltransferase family 9 protein [Prolixibacteraceae bacterium]